MRIQDLKLLYDYNYWATGRVLEMAAKVSAEQLVAPTTHSHGSLHRTLLHVLDTEYGWRTLCQHDTRPPDLAATDFPTLESLAQRWRVEQAALRAFLASLGDRDLDRLVRYTTDSGEARERVLWHCLFHVVNHGTHHRSQTGAILRGYGHSPGDIDFTVFMSQRR